MGFCGYCGESACVIRFTEEVYSFDLDIWFVGDTYLGSAEKLHKLNLGDTQCLKWGLRVLVFQIHPTIFYQSAGILNMYLP